MIEEGMRALVGSIFREWCGTGKWNKPERRLFSSITHGWRGRSLVRRLRVSSVGAAIDRKRREIEVKVTNDELARLRIKPHGPYGDWSVTVSPQS